MPASADGTGEKVERGAAPAKAEQPSSTRCKKGSQREPTASAAAQEGNAWPHGQPQGQGPTGGAQARSGRGGAANADVSQQNRQSSPSPGGGNQWPGCGPGAPGAPPPASGMVPMVPGSGGYPRGPQPGYPMGGAPMAPANTPISTEVMLLGNDNRLKDHREALKNKLSQATLSIDDLEYAVRYMLLSRVFAGTQGIPETTLMPYLPERFVTPPAPFRTIAELAASLPWLLRVHQSMQWVQQMPNGLMVVQRLICPAASEMGGLAAPDGVLAVDWRMVEEVMARPADAVQADQGYRPSMAGDPRFPRAPALRAGEDPMGSGTMTAVPGATLAEGADEVAAAPAAAAPHPPASGCRGNRGKGSQNTNVNAAPPQGAPLPPAAPTIKWGS